MAIILSNRITDFPKFFTGSVTPRDKCRDAGLVCVRLYVNALHAAAAAGIACSAPHISSARLSDVHVAGGMQNGQVPLPRAQQATARQTAYFVTDKHKSEHGKVCKHIITT